MRNVENQFGGWNQEERLHKGSDTLGKDAQMLSELRHIPGLRGKIYLQYPFDEDLRGMKVLIAG